MGTYRKGKDFIHNIVEYCSEHFMLPVLQFFPWTKQVLKPQFFTG